MMPTNCLGSQSFQSPFSCISKFDISSAQRMNDEREVHVP